MQPEIQSSASATGGITVIVGTGASVAVMDVGVGSSGVILTVGVHVNVAVDVKVAVKVGVEIGGVVGRLAYSVIKVTRMVPATPISAATIDGSMRRAAFLGLLFTGAWGGAAAGVCGV